MTTLSDRETVNEVIASNGDGQTTHIIEYENQFDGSLSWKLCRSKEHYDYYMETGAFINPKLVWTMKTIM